MALRALTSAVVFAFAATALAAPVPKGEKTNAEKIVGRWELTKSNGRAPTPKHFVDFTKDGKMILTVGEGEDATKYTGTYKIDKDSIDYELDMNDNKKAEKLKIKKFEDNELVTADPDEIEETFKRVKEKEKEKDKDKEKEKDKQ